MKISKRNLRSVVAVILPAIVFPVIAQTPATPPSATHANAAPAFAPPNLTATGVRSLAATCAPCHGTNGVSAGGAIPGLAGGNKENFIVQMQSFKDGKRQATVMQQIAKGYDDAEITALAEYFSAQKK